MNDQRTAQALELRRAGVSLVAIADQLGFSSPADAADAIDGELDRIGVTLDPTQVRRMAMDRLDQMLVGVWAKARKGDAAAAGVVMKIEQERIVLAGAPPTSVMVNAYERTIESLTTTGADVALIAAGRRIAERIDAAAGTLDAVAETKALYLMPHLMNVLRELGATPAARASVKNAKEGDGGGKLQDLRARRARRTADGAAIGA